MRFLTTIRPLAVALLLLLLYGGTTGVFAQSHLRGQRFLSASLGKVDRFDNSPLADGMGVHLETGRYNRRINALKFTADYLRKTYLVRQASQALLVPVEQYTLGYGYEGTLIRSGNRTRFLRLSGWGYAGYESLNRDISELAAGVSLSGRSRFLAGIDASVEVEIQPVVTGFRQRWALTPGAQPFHSCFYIGLRLNARQ